MIADLVRKLAAAGAPPEAIAIAVEAVEAAMAVDGDRKAKRAQAKRDERARQAATVARQSCDSATTVAPTSPEVSPNDIYSNPLPTPTASPKASPSPKPRKPTIAKPGDADEAIWRDFTQMRAKQGAPPTETAIAGIRREAGKLGWDLNQALAECCERSWRGFKAEWIKKDGRQLQRRGDEPNLRGTRPDPALDLYRAACAAEEAERAASSGEDCGGDWLSLPPGRSG